MKAHPGICVCEPPHHFHTKPIVAEEDIVVSEVTVTDGEQAARVVAFSILDGSQIASDSPWLRFATSERLLGVVNSYRGVYTKLVGLDNMYTVPFPDSGKRIASQRWHRDPEDQHVVKCILYFSDVDEDAGPFEYIPGSHRWPVLRQHLVRKLMTPEEEERDAKDRNAAWTLFTQDQVAASVEH